MRFYQLGKVLKVFAAFTCAVVVVHIVNYNQIYVEDGEELFIPERCKCIDNQGKVFDMCYSLPENPEIRGLSFSCNNLETAKELGLFNNKYVDLESKSLPSAVFVSAFSENHQLEGRRMLTTLRKQWKDQLLIVYDLGLTEETIDYFTKSCNVVVRRFPFEKYPEYVKALWQFRWKPIIIAETLKEFGAVWYVDSSAVFKNNNLEHVYDLVRCRKNLKTNSVPSIATRDRREDSTPHENGWNQDIWKENVDQCKKAAYLFHGYTGHGIFPATHNDTYDFFPTNFVEIKKTKAKMYEAGFIYAVRTKDTVEKILRWYVLCALEERCMAPNGARAFCGFHADKFTTYANCHRFDQSVVNLLAANAFYYDRKYYVSEIVDFFNIVRGVFRGDSFEKPQTCDMVNS